MSDPKPAIYLGLVLFLIGAFLIRLNFQEKPQVIPKNQKVTLTATVLVQPRLSERNQIIEIGDSRLFAQLYPRYTVGDRLKVEGFADDKGRIFNAKIEKIGERASVSGFLSKARQKISADIDKILPAAEATLVGGMVLGIDEIGQDLREKLIATGTIHVVVVSGQNLSIVAGLFLGSSRYIGRRKSLALSILAVFAYALLTGFEPPVARASLMVLMSSIAIYFGRQVMPLWSLILAALLILFIWPATILEISFQLTFAATLGIMTLGQWLSRFFKSKLKILNLFGDNAAIATSAYLFTTPIIWWHFERISLVAPVVNTLVAELVLPIMILGFAIAGASLIWLPLAQVMAYLVYIPAFVFIGVVEVFGG